MMRIVEVGPRDGLQNETATIPSEVKVAFVNALSDAGVSEIEVSAFVSPRWIPQLADAEEVFKGIARKAGVVYSALVPNLKGLDRALAVGADKISVFTSASETFNQKNINTSIAGSIRRFGPVLKKARETNVPVRGYVSTAFWCAYEGQIRPEVPVAVAERLVELGVHEISIADTIGKASPDEVKRLLDVLLSRVASHRVGMHFHDTYARGMDNVLASLSYGVRTFDASVGGLGGCPYAPGASGNVATETLVQTLEDAGETVGVDVRALGRARELLAPYLTDERRTLPKDGTPSCVACEHSQGDACCKTE